jgi:hypothetical protein
MRFRILRRIIPVSVVLGLPACVDLTGLDIAGGHLVSISVSDGTVVEVGDTVRVTAYGGVDGLLGLFGLDYVRDARWTVSDPSIARVEAAPPPPPEDSSWYGRTLIRGLRPGSVRVMATARGVTGEATARVIPVIASIQVQPIRDTLAVGDTIVVTAAALDAGGALIQGVPLTFAVTGGAQLAGRNDWSARVVGTAAGPATVSVRFRHAIGEATLVVTMNPAP